MHINARKSKKKPLADLGRWCWGRRRARKYHMMHCNELSGSK